MKIKIALIIIVLLLLSTIAYSISVDKTSQFPHYTSEELNELYLKYNITENDIKFANGELPHYKDGTVLDGKTRVIVTETGEPPEGSVEGVDYDAVITMDEMMTIEQEARATYIQKYGVDPANPKLDTINGTLLPVEEVRRLVKKGFIYPSE
ncbi:MAG: hypothetical protein P1P72_07190 [ANME-2 cluster archaeon]|nr:hypothetical protein [ANME-2 cluster archaeon]